MDFPDEKNRACKGVKICAEDLLLGISQGEFCWAEDSSNNKKKA